jgi:uncharacterized protein YcaQ
MARSPHHVVEYWAHEASFILVTTRRLLQWRMEDWRQHAWREVRQIAEVRPELLQAVLGVIHSKGAMTVRQIEEEFQEAPAGKDNWGWNWSNVKLAVEALFWSGELMAIDRTKQFQRIYDLPERVLPDDAGAQPVLPPSEAIYELVAIAAKACGVATARSLRDYFRLDLRQTTEAIQSLVDRGVLIPAQVEGWQKPAYTHKDARIPRRIVARALLSPFDSLIFERERLKQLFDFDYRLEIYTPQAKRRYGYYVLPFLLGERLVARVDMKADRTQGTLIVRGAYAEVDAPDTTAAELLAELQEMATWLGLSEVIVENRGDLAEKLRLMTGHVRGS